MANTVKKGSSLNHPELLSTLTEETKEFATEALEKALKNWRPRIVLALEHRFRALLKEGQTTQPEAVSHNDWTGVESLSRLRSLVGGRFQNIKKKWVDAGFPLREHRGDRWKDFSVDESAWVDLSNWILKQGFEARLTRDSKEFLFELRAISK